MSKKSRCYIDIHVLQDVPPSCVNRDDTGSPKTAVYGGVTRARVSSQAWKHAIRICFRGILDEDSIGTRTKRIYNKVSAALLALDPTLEENRIGEMADVALKNAGFSPKKDDKSENTLFFISNAQAKAVAELVIQGEENKNAYKKALKSHPSIDMALFGRMVANDSDLSIEAAAQVAHSISTHAVQNEFDYFTAVDDYSIDDNLGAGHIGTTEFNSATLYRYATLNVDELSSQIPDDTVIAVKAFIEAFCFSMPTGKQNSFANRTLPDLVYITIRKDQPINMVGAFEKPVQGANEGYFTASERAMISYAKKTYELFAPEPERAFGCSQGEYLEEIAEIMPLRTIIDKVGDFVAEYLSLDGVKK